LTPIDLSGEGAADEGGSRDELVPWSIDKAHRWAYPLAMLRAESSRRALRVIEPPMLARLQRWLLQMSRDDTVVHYDPEPGPGFVYVARRPGVDLDLIREPPA